MYHLNYSKEFDSKVKKLIKKNQSLSTRVKKAKAIHKKTKKLVFTSKATGDIRIIWEFSKKEIRVIDVMDIGTHSGKYKVYK